MIGWIKTLVFVAMSPERRFRRIYRHNKWRDPESRSGTGSTLANTENIRTALPALLDELGVTSITDVACGDFNWMRLLLAETPGITRYVGIDIVPEIVAANTAAHGSARVSFRHGNVIAEVPPAADLIVFRDCTIHLSFADAARAFANIRRSGARYLLTSSYRGAANATDIPTGRWRPVDLEAAPFGFPDPAARFVENEAAGGSAGAGKALCLWPVAALPGA